MRTTRAVKAAVGATPALALSLSGVTPARADIAPTSQDAVAVGSGTVQYLVNFLDDADTAAHTGLNTIVKNRVFSFDADRQHLQRQPQGHQPVVRRPTGGTEAAFT